MVVAVLCNLSTEMTFCQLYHLLVKSQSPVPPTPKKRLCKSCEYQDVGSIGDHPSLSALACLTSWLSFRCFILLNFRFFFLFLLLFKISVHQIQFIRTGLSGIGTLQISSSILKTLSFPETYSFYFFFSCK